MGEDGCRWGAVMPLRQRGPPRRYTSPSPTPSGQRRLAHLHLMRPDEPRWYEQLAFRDALRANPALAGEYARLKARAADEHHHDREAYTNAKQAFVRRVLERNS